MSDIMDKGKLIWLNLIVSDLHISSLELNKTRVSLYGVCFKRLAAELKSGLSKSQIKRLIKYLEADDAE